MDARDAQIRPYVSKSFQKPFTQRPSGSWIEASKNEFGKGPKENGFELDLDIALAFTPAHNLVSHLLLSGGRTRTLDVDIASLRLRRLSSKTITRGLVSITPADQHRLTVWPGSAGGHEGDNH